jgi:GNAT superfamily N-acetyltransferase
VIRLLNAADAASLDQFLATHCDTSMFLRSNSRRVGLEYRDEVYYATYVGVFRDGELAGVAAHGWNGIVQLQAPGGDDAGTLARACVETSGRKVTGLTGPVAQVRAARTALQMDDAMTTLDGDERLYALDLVNLRIPDALASGRITCRVPNASDRDVVVAWRMAYDFEVLGASDTPTQRARSASVIDGQIADGRAWIALDGDTPVSLSAFNAVLPDIVQLGGIFTPPELRGRGYAKAAVAHSLQVARGRGVTRAVLFTPNPNAERTYGAIGFERLGDYALVLF